MEEVGGNVNGGGGKLEVLCKVCGDKASGKHYGVASCDGCRGFFKRSIRRNLEYICKENNRCVVDVTRRNQCQACRFRKCLQMNMKRDAVQHERAPRTVPTSMLSDLPPLAAYHHHHPYAHPHVNPHHPFVLGPAAPSLLSSPAHLHHHHHQHTAHAHHLNRFRIMSQLQQQHPALLGSVGGPGNPLYNPSTAAAAAAAAAASLLLHPNTLTSFGAAADGAGTNVAQPIQHPVPLNSVGYLPAFKPVITTPLGFLQNTTKRVQIVSSNALIVGKDDEVTSSEEAMTKSNTDSETQKTVRDETKSPETSLDLPISTETTVPKFEASYMHIFPAESIFESAAKLLFFAIKWARTIPSFLQLSFRDQSILLEGSWSELFILTAAQWSFSIDEDLFIDHASPTSSKKQKLESDVRKLREIINRLTLLRVDHTEHACLKALVLFKAECNGLGEPLHVELLQDQTHVMLHQYCDQQQRHQKGRFGKLLLTLPAIQAVGRSTLEELLFRQTVGDITIDRLLGDLAKAATG